MAAVDMVGTGRSGGIEESPGTRIARAKAAAMALAVLLTVLAVAAVVWSRTGDGAPGRRGATATGKATEPGVYAYTTAHAVVVVRDGRTVARAAGDFAWASEQPRWTLDGRFLFFLTNPVRLADQEFAVTAPPDPRLVFVRAATGAVHELPCPACASAGPVRADEVMAYEQDPLAPKGGQHVLRFDLASGQPPIRFTIALPTALPQIRFLTAIPGTAVAAGANPNLTSNYGGPETLLLMTSDGVTRTVDYVGGNMQISGAAGTAHSSYPAGGIALVDGMHAGVCEWGNSVELLNTRTGKVTSTDLSAAAPPHSRLGDNAGLSVNDLWWGAKGRLYATVTSWTCDHTKEDPVVTAVPPSLWRLTGTRWHRDNPRRIGMTRPLGGDRSLLLAPLPTDGTGSALFFRDGTRSRRVADHVLEVSVPGH